MSAEAAEGGAMMSWGAVMIVCADMQVRSTCVARLRRSIISEECFAVQSGFGRCVRTGVLNMNSHE